VVSDFVSLTGQEVVCHQSCDEVDVRKNIELMDCLKLFANMETLSRDDAW